MVCVPAGYVRTTLEETNCIGVGEGEKAGGVEKTVFGIMAVKLRWLYYHCLAMGFARRLFAESYSPQG